MTVHEINAPPTPPAEESVTRPPRVEQFKGAVLGCVLGDVTGAWAERRSADEARDYAKHFVAKFDFSNVGSHHRGVPFGQVTDDAQLTRELLLSLVDEGDWVPEDFADRIARIFAQDAVVGYGAATQEAAVRLLDGASWKESGTPPPRAGNGGAMRACPIGLFYWNDVEGLVKAATEQAIITHKAPLSLAGSVAVAGAVAMCLNASKTTSAPHEPGWWAWLARFVDKQNEEFGEDIRQLADKVFAGRKKKGWKPGCDEESAEVKKFVKEGDDSRWSGISPWARSSVLWSLYCLMTHPRDLWKAIELAIAVGGDTDTMAAMAGAMVGAHVGLDGFPEGALDVVAPQVTDVKAPMWTWEEFEKLAEHLHAIVVERHEEAVEASTLGPCQIDHEPENEDDETSEPMNVLDFFGSGDE